MTNFEILTLLAVLAAPLLALQAQRVLDRLREHHARKMRLFDVLMMTRGSRLASEHIAALNRIYLDFDGLRIWFYRHQTRSEKKVIEAWKSYHDHLNDSTSSDAEMWASESDKRFVELLHAMTQSLGYQFDRVDLKRTVYAPRGVAQLETEQRRMRQLILSILAGETPVPITMIQTEDALKKTEQLQNAMIGSLDPHRIVKVQIVSDTNIERS